MRMRGKSLWGLKETSVDIGDVCGCTAIILNRKSGFIFLWKVMPPMQVQIIIPKVSLLSLDIFSQNQLLTKWKMTFDDMRQVNPDYSLTVLNNHHVLQNLHTTGTRHEQFLTVYPEDTALIRQKGHKGVYM